MMIVVIASVMPAIYVVSIVIVMNITGANIAIGPHWHVVAVRIVAVAVVADGMNPPIGMNVLIVVKPRQARAIQSQPNVIRPQIKVLRAHNTHIFSAVPHVAVRHTHCDYRSRQTHNGCWHLHDWSGNINLNPHSRRRRHRSQR